MRHQGLDENMEKTKAQRQLESAAALKDQRARKEAERLDRRNEYDRHFSRVNGILCSGCATPHDEVLAEALTYILERMERER